MWLITFTVNSLQVFKFLVLSFKFIVPLLPGSLLMVTSLWLIVSGFTFQVTATRAPVFAFMPRCLCASLPCCLGPRCYRNTTIIVLWAQYL
jgi:hypothetical protein